MEDLLPMMASAIGKALWELRVPIAIYFGGFLALSLIIELTRSLIRQIKAEISDRRYQKSGLAAVDQMDGLEFERYLGYLFRRAGFGVQLTPPSGDYGVDLILEHPISGERIAVQAKRWTDSVGIRAVQEVHMGRSYYQCSRAIVVTNSTFTTAAEEAAKACGVTLVDRPQLEAIIQQTLPEVEQMSA